MSADDQNEMRRDPSLRIFLDPECRGALGRQQVGGLLVFPFLVFVGCWLFDIDEAHNRSVLWVVIPLCVVLPIFVYRTLRWIGGKEILLLEGGRLTLQTKLGPFERGKQFDIREVGPLVYDAPWSGSRTRFPGYLRTYAAPRRGSIAFTYRGRTHRFGLGLSPAESDEVIKAVQKALADPPDSGISDQIAPSETVADKGLP